MPLNKCNHKGCKRNVFKGEDDQEYEYCWQHDPDYVRPTRKMKMKRKKRVIVSKKTKEISYEEILGRCIAALVRSELRKAMQEFFTKG